MQEAENSCGKVLRLSASTHETVNGPPVTQYRGNTRLASLPLPLRCYGGRLRACVALKISDKKGFYCHTVAVVYRSLTICHHFRILYSVLQGMRNAAPRVSVFIVSSKELSYSRWPRLADTSMNSFRQSLNGWRLAKRTAV